MYSAVGVGWCDFEGGWLVAGKKLDKHIFPNLASPKIHYLPYNIPDPTLVSDDMEYFVGEKENGSRVHWCKDDDAEECSAVGHLLTGRVNSEIDDYFASTYQIVLVKYWQPQEMICSMLAHDFCYELARALNITCGSRMRVEEVAKTYPKFVTGSTLPGGVLVKSVFCGNDEDCGIES